MPSWASRHFVKWSHISGVCMWHGHTVYSGGMLTPFLRYHLGTLFSSAVAGAQPAAFVGVLVAEMGQGTSSTASFANSVGGRS